MEHPNLELLETLEARITPSSGSFGGSHLGEGGTSSVKVSGTPVYIGPDPDYIGTLLPFGAPEIISPSELHYRDADGDGITVKFDRDVLTQETSSEAFRFEEGERGYFLAEIDVAKLAVNSKSLRHLDITITATSAYRDGDNIEEDRIVLYRPLSAYVDPPASNGKADVGQINAAGIDLGEVWVSGNLERIVAGDSKAGTAGLESLMVDSLGTLGDAALAQAGDVTSVITGALRKLEVKDDIVAALVKIQGGSRGDLVEGHVGGDVIGGAFAYSGSIEARGTIKSLAIDGDLVGGSALNAGSIHGGKQIKQLSIGGGLLGGSARYAGRIDSLDIGELSIGGDVHFGKGEYSASIEAARNIKSIHVEGDVIGGAADRSGSIVAHKNIGEAGVRGNIDGGIGDFSGYLSAERKISSISVGGDLLGSFGERSGSVAAFDGKIVKQQIEGHRISGAGVESGQFSSFVNAPEPREFVGVGAFEPDPPGSDVDEFSSPNFPGSTSADLSYVLKIGGFYGGDYVAAVEYVIAVSKEFLVEEGRSAMEIFVMGPGRSLTVADLNDGYFTLPDSLIFTDAADGKIQVTQKNAV
jgi:hypothetical protein